MYSVRLLANSRLLVKFGGSQKVTCGFLTCSLFVDFDTSFPKPHVVRGQLCIYYNFFSRSCMDGHLGSFHVLVIVNNVANKHGGADTLSN